MKGSKENVKTAILVIAEYLGIEDAYNARIRENPPLPELSKSIVYDMFINEFDSSVCSNESFEACKTIKSYARELNLVGYVTFEK